MAEVPEHNPMQEVYLFVGFLVIVIIFWYASGGPSQADLRGIFLGAPTEAGGTGQAYGPQFPPNSSAPSDAQQSAAQAQQFGGGSVGAPQSVAAPSEPTYSNAASEPPCVYQAPSGAQTTLQFSYVNAATDENACLNQCRQVSNSSYGTASAGTCFYVDQSGVQYVLPLNQSSY